MAEGREGDWECSGCNNRNYAFRSFCNRCKQPRLLVDVNTPPNSKWLPRIGDWICSGCTNNNYASREKCKKCGQPKELAALPAIAMPGVFARGQGGLQPSMGIPQMGTSAFEQSLAPHSTWPLGGSVAPQGDTKGWRNGDWICNCGFHNYSSRTQCNKCKAAPPALGIKRLASDEPVHYWDNKRLNAGAGPQVNHYMQSYSGFGPVTGFIGDQRAGLCAPYPTGSAAMAPSVQGPLPQLQTATLVGKGAKQWRDGDWMCSNCNNHNYASRSECNRCKTQKSLVAQSVGVA